MRRSAAALRHNLARASVLAPGRKIWAVIKADGYGHGMEWAAAELAGLAHGFAVSCVEEALALRASGTTAPILVLQGTRTGAEWGLCARHHLQPVLHEEAQLPGLTAFDGELPGLWIKLDTGMHRLGFAPLKAQALFQQLSGHPAARHGLHWLTHFACADQPGHPMNHDQLERFTHAVGELPGLRSVANSAAVMSGAAAAVARAEWTRPGIMLYGPSPLEGTVGPEHDLRPVMTVTAPLIAVKSLPPGASVGYGATWTARRATRAGVVAIGYADGYPRHAPTGTPVLVRGRECPLIGRVSMDMLEIDLTEAPDAKVGDGVTLWGEGLPVERIAEAAGTISYDLLTRVAGRLQVVDIE
jgi:alanine racemase